MLTSNIALVSELSSTQLPFGELAEVAAALSKQIARDFGPLWGVTASASAFPRLEEVPLGYWKVLIQADIGQSGILGIHKTSLNEPIAFVEYGTTWPLQASHETLEMLADPSLSRLVPATSKTAGIRVQILVEVCDPCQRQTYPVNGVSVSDFVTPQYFDPLVSAGARYSFTGAVNEPQGILPGGYLTFFNPGDSKWYFDGDFGQGRAIYRAPAPTGASRDGLRGAIDRHQRSYESRAIGGQKLNRVSPASLQTRGHTDTKKDRVARAKALRLEIETWRRLPPRKNKTSS